MSKQSLAEIINDQPWIQKSPNKKKTYNKITNDKVWADTQICRGLTHKYVSDWHTSMWQTDTQICGGLTQICVWLTHKYVADWHTNMCLTDTQECLRLTHKYVVDWHTNMWQTDTWIYGEMTNEYVAN